MYRRSALVLCLLACYISSSRAQSTSLELAAEPTSRPTMLADRAVDLLATDDGQLFGRVVDAQGQPVTDASVRLLDSHRTVGITRTDHQGDFRLAGATPGAKRVALDDVHQMVRIWSFKNAPPQAQRRLLVVSGPATVRAQCVPPATTPVGNRPCTGQQVLYRILQRPWLVAAGAGAAIVIPIAEDDDDDGNQRSSTRTIERPDAS